MITTAKLYNMLNLNDLCKSLLHPLLHRCCEALLLCPPSHLRSRLIFLCKIQIRFLVVVCIPLVVNFWRKNQIGGKREGFLTSSLLSHSMKTQRDITRECAWRRIFVLSQTTKITAELCIGGKHV